MPFVRCLWQSRARSFVWAVRIYVGWFVETAGIGGDTGYGRQQGRGAFAADLPAAVHVQAAEHSGDEDGVYVLAVLHAPLVLAEEVAATARGWGGKKE